MGVAGRKRKHSEKMKQKRAAKAAKKAKYQALAGTSRKSKKQGNKSQIAGMLKNAHAMGNCGNPGCKRCFPQFRPKKWIKKVEAA